MADVDGIDGFGRGFSDLERSLAGAEAMTAAFSAELGRMQESLVFTNREVALLSTGIGRGLRSAFDGVVFDGMRLSDALERVRRSMVDSVYAVAMRPVQNAVGGAIAQGMNGVLSGMFPFAQGGAIGQGRVMAFARGGVVGGPTAFPMRGGTGLMGEAGPEAILPLARGADGKLGVRAGRGGGGPRVTINVTTPDVQGFQQSRGQIAAGLARVIAQGERNM
ncbi:phage tail tape measure protein [Frigidibacter sp. MR17.24]|uniref:phage tail tape measure protein n=1 Tax=Frigidibacter sp. MR17.24 TaxID=3127345 RepID=UPI003012ADB0